jgi:glycosyltransferase EpsE
MSSKLVSIILPVYNGEKTIHKSAVSILNQTYKKIELLILDDGSIDNTKEKLFEISKLDARVKIFFNKENIGLTKSLNILINKCQGEFIARQDADDFSFENRISKQLEYLDSDKYDICVSRALINDSNKKIPGISYYFPKKLIIKYKNPYIHGSAVFKAKVLKNLGFYDEKFYFAQDYKLFNDALKYGCKIKYLKDALYKLNTKNNISSNFIDKQNYYADCVKRNIIPKI